MQLYLQDKAIEFNALFKSIEGMISELKSIGIDVTIEEERLANISNECSKNVLFITRTIDIESIYQKGIEDLTKLKEDLNKHSLYYNAYKSSSNIEEELEQSNLNNDSYEKQIIDLLIKIQTSDTRVYESEKMIVEKIYGLAYKVIKRELIVNGHSKVLDWVKNNEIASSYINTLVKVDIALYDTSIITNDIIKEVINSLKEGSIDISYLNEGLILFLAMQDDNNVNKIEAYLNDLIEDLNSSKKDIKKSEDNNKRLKVMIEEITESLKKSNIYKELGLFTSFLAVLVGLYYGARKLAPLMGHKEYKTSVEYFTTKEDGETPDYPEYMKKMSGFHKTTLKAYDVWRREDVFLGDYERNIVTYNLSDIEITNLEDFLTYDFSNINPREETETREILEVNELYNQAIVEITRLKQDENDYRFVPNETIQNIFLIITAIVLCVLSLSLGHIMGKKIRNKLNDRKELKITNRKNLEELEKGLEYYKELCIKNEKFRKNFLTIYERLAEYIKSPNIKEQYLKLKK